MNVDEILSLRASGYTKRWHTLQHLGQAQTVAEHSAQALSLLLLLHPNPSMDLVKAVLWHDSAERVVGDVPAPVRRKNALLSSVYEQAEEQFFHDEAPTAADALDELDLDDRAWLKAVDVLELLLWCYDQIMLGNSHCEIVANRAMTYLSGEDIPGPVREFVAATKNNRRSFA